MRNKKAIVLIFGLLAILLLGVSCSSSEEEDQNDIDQPQAVTEIIIGNYTDKTGASSTAMDIIDKALNDAVKYYNEEGFIPGDVKLKAIYYDGQYESANDIPGYEKLKADGAHIIYTGVPSAPLTMKARVERDKMVLFAAAANYDTIYPPGYIFVPATLPEENAYTILEWVARYDPDFPTDRPAKVGAAGWSTPYNIALHDAMEEYADAYPERYKWIGSYTIDVGFNWQTEVEALKDCDYVMTPVMLVNFVKEYRKMGYQGKFLASPAQAAFLGLVTDARLWDELDGAYFILPSGWWSDDNYIINRTKELLYANHPDKAEEIMADGASYIAIDGIYQMLDIIGDAVEIAGPQGFNSDTLYEAAQSYSQEVNGVTRASFGPTKRSSIDRVGIYQASGTEEDLVRVQEEWYPVLHSLD